MYFSGLSNWKVAMFVHDQKRLGKHGCPLHGRNEIAKVESLIFVGVTAVSTEARFLSS